MSPRLERWVIADCLGSRIDGDRNTCTEEHEPGVLYRHVDERQVGDSLVAPGPGLPSSAAVDEAWLRNAKARRRARGPDWQHAYYDMSAPAIRNRLAQLSDQWEAWVIALDGQGEADLAWPVMFGNQAMAAMREAIRVVQDLEDTCRYLDESR